MGNASGFILILSGPSGVGKNTLINFLIAKAGLKQYAAYTTRPARAGEVNGVDYKFVSEAEFEKLRTQYEFHDIVRIGDHLYGSPLIDFQAHLERNDRLVLHLTVSSALALKKKMPSVYVVFVSPPDPHEAVNRMKRRGMSREDMKVRLSQEPTDFQLSGQCDLVIVNHTGRPEEAADQIFAFLKRISHE